jgi:hypothetical protein
MNVERVGRTGLAILAKAPVPGLAKTRLIPHLGAEGAAALQRWLLQRIVTTALAAEVGPVTLWCAPDVDHPEFSDCRNRGQVVLRPQADGDLGARMHAAVAGSPAPAGVLVVGTDCPVLTPGLLRRAAASLDQDDATVIPAEDGGYVLIGVRHPSLRVFTDIDWGSGKVMAQTRERLSEAGWRWSEFPPLWDVDRDEDFQRLCDLFPEDFPPGRWLVPPSPW